MEHGHIISFADKSRVKPHKTDDQLAPL